MGKKDTCLSVLLAALAVQNAAAATSFWTAFLEITFINSTTGQLMSVFCECGLYGLDSPLRDAQGQLMLPTSSPTACGPLAWRNVSVAPWIAVVERGNCTFTQKINVARKAGADAVVIYNAPGTGNDKSPMLHPVKGTKSRSSQSPRMASWWLLIPACFQVTLITNTAVAKNLAFVLVF
ncbi:E3 ubiquitin-protein ligase RNF133-like [Arapaima gigas]